MFQALQSNVMGSPKRPTGKTTSTHAPLLSWRSNPELNVPTKIPFMLYYTIITERSTVRTRTRRGNGTARLRFRITIWQHTLGHECCNKQKQFQYQKYRIRVTLRVEHRRPRQTRLGFLLAQPPPSKLPFSTLFQIPMRPQRL